MSTEKVRSSFWKNSSTNQVPQNNFHKIILILSEYFKSLRIDNKSYLVLWLYVQEENALALKSTAILLQDLVTDVKIMPIMTW